jgi:hypothetical protein
LFVVVDDATLVATLVAVTVTPGMRAFCESRMRPVIPPRKSCADAVSDAAASASTTQMNRFIAPPSMTGNRMSL